MLEVEPMFAFSIGDPFWRTLGMGVRVEHHFDERWSISMHALGGFSLLAAPVQVCSDTCDSPAAGKLRSAPGKLQLLAGVQVGWAPVYGKLSLMGESTLHFDAYIAAGPELVRELIAPDGASAEQGRWAMGGRLSIGERLFLSNRFMVRIAASELVYSGGEPEESEGAGWAGGARVASRAAEDPALALLLLSEPPVPGKLPPALAVALARGHLERALQLAPPEEGSAFETLQQQGPRLEPA